MEWPMYIGVDGMTNVYRGRWDDQCIIGVVV